MALKSGKTVRLNITFAENPKPFYMEPSTIEVLDFSDEEPWVRDAVVESCRDPLAFEAPFLGCEEATTVHVAGSHDEGGALQMEVITPIGHAFITKEQAMAFFGLVEA